jgi:peptidoglycan/LPS O-acetylase OafA/YrhL
MFVCYTMLMDFSVNVILVRPENPQLRADIQALRAVAVLSVVIYHIWPTRLIGGFMGVDVFFVISGYLMTLTIWKGVSGVAAAQATRDNGRSLLGASLRFLLSFYAKRIRRLAPAATVLLLVVLLAVLLVGTISLQQNTAQQVFASSIFMQNWFLASQAVDYLGADAGATAVQHFWSLSVEEQFYMIWPLLLLITGLCIFAWHKKRFANSHPNGTVSVAPLIVVILFTVSSLAYGIYLTYHNTALAYFVTPARIWELSIGGIIVFLPEIKHRDLKLLLPWLGLALIAYVFVQWGGKDFPGWKAIVPTVATALVIWGGAEKYHADFSVSNLARFRPVQFFGDISYSLYLWHWPLIVLIPYYLEADIHHHNSKLKLALFIASILFASLSYYLIEQPTRKLGAKPWQIKHVKPAISRHAPGTDSNHEIGMQRGSSMRPVAVTWAIGTLCLALVLLPAFAVEKRAQNFTENIVQIAYEQAMDPDDIGFGARATMHIGEAGVATNPYGQTDREWSQFGRVAVHGTMTNQYEYGGFETFTTDTRELDVFAETGVIDSDKTILVIGDSHSMQWYPALEVAARELGYRLLFAGTWHAAGGLYELTYEFGDTWPHHSGAPQSVERANERFNFIKDNLWPQADIVIAGISNGYFVVEPADTNPENTSHAVADIASTFKEIYEVTGSKPILIQDPPKCPGYTDDNMEWVNGEDHTGKYVQKYSDALKNRLKDEGFEDTFSYIEVSTNFVDDDGMAHTQIGGVPVYYDSNHINTLFSASCGEYFTKQLQALGL